MRYGFEESRADFSDCLIAGLSRQAGCEYTAILDRDAPGNEALYLTRALHACGTMTAV